MNIRRPLLLAVIAVAACSPSTPPIPTVTATAAPIDSESTPDPSAPPLALADAAECPVTRPAAAPPEFRDRLFGGAGAHGNDDLWVGGLGTDGVVSADPRLVDSDGSIGWKLGWWRITPGSLRIAGRRIDREGPPLRASVPDGYGTTGFQASGVDFPTEGCWEVTGTVGSSDLMFVMFVIKT